MHIVVLCATRRGYRFLFKATDEVDAGDIGSVVLTGDSAIPVKDVQFEGEERVNASAVLKSPSQRLRGRSR